MSAEVERDFGRVCFVGLERATPFQPRRDWDGVIRERIERYDCGKAKTRPAADVFDALDKRLGE